MENRIYLCIDLKSFYASVECVERGLDPLTTPLAVADPERSEKTICLAVSPAMKKLGVANRCRVFQIPSHIDYIMASPRMQLYIDYAAWIYSIYLKYIAREDIHVYSIDEAFLDITDYMALYKGTPWLLARKITGDILETTGITAAAGIGTNLYLAKVALDITAKHSPFNIGYLTGELYCKTLWQHRPLTDFWRIGEQTAKKLAGMGILTMRDIAHASEDMLYRAFGIDAELLIDHARGIEPVTIADIKNYEPKSRSVCSSQVLSRNYSCEECKLVLKEMVDSLCLELASKNQMTASLSLTLGYSRESDKKPASGTVSLKAPTRSYRRIIPHVLSCYERIVNPALSLRRLTVSCNRLTNQSFEQYDLFYPQEELERDLRLQEAALSIKKRFGRNALVRGMDLQEAATAMERNLQIGGHKSGE